MITILISHDEEKAKEIISQLLRQEGYALTGTLAEGEVINIVKKDKVKDLSGLKDTVIELEDSLYDLKKGVLFKSILEVIEKPIIERALERTDGNQFKAARILGINRNTIRAKIKKLGIDPDKYKQ
jgi:two-component system nitrogen regulation response regulator GlnG